MITKHDLQEAIAECEGQRNPTANTCIKLAAFYTIKQHLFPDEEFNYSFAPVPSENSNKVEYDSFNFYNCFGDDMKIYVDKIYNNF